MRRATIRRMVWSFVLVLAGLGISAALTAVLMGISGCGGSSAPLAITVNATATTVDGGDAVTLTATVANDKNSAGVQWSLSGPGTLSGQTTTSTTYTAPATTNAAQTATITATSVADSTKTTTTTITIPAALSVTSTSLGAASVGGRLQHCAYGQRRNHALHLDTEQRNPASKHQSFVRGRSFRHSHGRRCRHV